MRQIPHSYARKVTVDVGGRYLLYLPPDYDARPSDRFPLLMFLHGAGERGEDLEKVKLHGPPKEIAQGRDFPFIVVSPQCPEDQYWDVAALIGLLDEIEATCRVDQDRVYLTGLSLGGHVTYELAAKVPHRFAAIAPIAAWGDRFLAAPLRNVPMWSIHGDADEAVPLSAEVRLVEALRELGADIRFDVVPGGTHDTWTAPYAGEELYKWFLSHRLNRP